MADCFITSYVNQYVEPLYTSKYGVSSDTIDGIFNSTYAYSQSNLDSLSGTILGQGIDYFTKENYKQAITYFKSAAALSPGSDNASNAYDYMGQAYVKLENYDAAIKTYKEAIRQYPTNDAFYKALADVYLTENMPDEALQEYKTAVNINPNDAETQYSLGQSYLTTGDLDNARKAFNAVIRIKSTNEAGYYGLGQVARAEGNLSDAEEKLTKAISLNSSFELAYVELGYTYADMGKFQQADDQLAILQNQGSTKATTLYNYITQVTQPKMASVTSLDGFDTSLGANTSVSYFSSSLESADSSQLFSMKFSFSKDMDESSIINPYNWKISRATLRENGSIYNNGLTPPATEASISPIPAFVTYDNDKDAATIYFRVSQNDNADATIDPEHIVFKFYGVDAYGKAMDKSADEYSGFSNIA